jgi:hypothetical protein
MNVISEILDHLGVSSVAEMDVNENFTITVDGFEDLTIEKIGDGRLSVGQYYQRRGDRISDPEAVFVINDGDWRPVRYTQHPMVHQHDESGIDLDGFLSTWDQNLREQGFVAAAHGRTADD